jgi:hypothetical protein
MDLWQAFPEFRSLADGNDTGEQLVLSCVHILEFRGGLKVNDSIFTQIVNEMRNDALSQLETRLLSLALNYSLQK